jgi:TPP-dependent pyruvate/acetoin dehydrogenase alpha subunit
MTDKNDYNSDVLIADIMLRVTAIEKLLIEKGVLTKEEIFATTEEIAQKVAKVILDKAQTSKNIDEFISSLENKDKKESSN